MDFQESTPMSNFVKILPVRAGLFHADGWAGGQRDMTKLIDTFCNFVNVPKNLMDISTKN
jgi:hypothetical protein